MRRGLIGSPLFSFKMARYLLVSRCISYFHFRATRLNHLIDNDFPTEPPSLPSGKRHDFFGRMVAISLAVHVISSVILLTPRQSFTPTPSVSFLELKNLDTGDRVTAPLPTEPLFSETIDEGKNAEEPSAPPYPESLLLEENVRQSVTEAQTNPESLTERSFSLGLTNGYFSSIATGETLRESIRDYYFQMLREINEKWWLTGASRGMWRKGALVEVVVARDGSIVDRYLVKSSGNRAFDRAIMTALAQATPLPPLPADFKPEYFRAPLRFIAPLNLLGS